MFATGVITAVLSLVAAATGIVIGEGVGTTIVVVAALVMLAGVLWSGWLGVSALRRPRP